MARYFYYGKYLSPFFRRRKEKSYSVLALSLLTTLVFGAFAIAPTLKSIARVRKDVDALLALTGELSDKIDALDQARAVFMDAIPYEDALRQAIYPFSGWSDEVRKLGNLAQENDLRIVSVDAENDRLLQIVVLGDYPRIERFVSSLEERNPNYRIVGLALNKEGQKGQFVRAEVKIRVVFAESDNV